MVCMVCTVMEKIIPTPKKCEIEGLSFETNEECIEYLKNKYKIGDDKAKRYLNGEPLSSV